MPRSLGALATVATGQFRTQVVWQLDTRGGERVRNPGGSCGGVWSPREEHGSGESLRLSFPAVMPKSSSALGPVAQVNPFSKGDCPPHRTCVLAHQCCLAAFGRLLS